MVIKEIYLVGTRVSSYRSGEPARIVGVKMVTPDGGLNPRVCYHIVFDDGKEDYIPVSEIENGNFSVKTLHELLSVGVPAVAKIDKKSVCIRYEADSSSTAEMCIRCGRSKWMHNIPYPLNTNFTGK